MIVFPPLRHKPNVVYVVAQAFNWKAEWKVTDGADVVSKKETSLPLFEF